MEQLAIVGKALPRLDGVAKATGQAIYSLDLMHPGMLFGQTVRSPLAHARILNIDITAAKKLKGVKAVITAKDTPRLKYGPIVPDRYPLALDKVRFIGDEVAALAAVDRDTAEEAAQLIKVDYEELPAVFDPEEAMSPGAPRIHQAERNVAKHVEIVRGEPDQGFGQSDYLFDDRFSTPSVHQCYMEPVACLGQYDSSGRLTLWTGLQDYFLCRAALAQALAMPESKIRLIQTYVGGAFGGKHLHQLQIICALLAMKVGRPIKLENSREEEFAATLPRVPAIINLKTGVKKDGTLMAKETRVIADNGAYTHVAPGIMQTTAMRTDSLYKIRNIRIIADLAYTNKTPTGAYRGFGNPQGAFAVESQLDMIAERLGIDPLELRIKNGVQAGYVSAHGWVIRSCGLKDCLKKVAQVSAWQERRSHRKPGLGLGLAGVIHVSGNRSGHDFDGSSAIIKVNDDGRVHLLSGENDTGQGVTTTLAQIAAEELGVAYQDVEVAAVDTDLSPFGLGCYADRVTTVGGNAVKRAAADARDQLFSVAARLLEASPSDLRAKEGKIFVAGSPERYVTVAQAAKAATYRQGGAPILGTGSYDADSVQPDRDTLYGNLSPTYVFGAQLAEVEVDEETGQVKLLELVAAHDLGRPINPFSAQGQIEGSVAQGLGFALTEEIRSHQGKVINGQFTDYKIAAATDMPRVVSLLVESDDPVGPFGAKGIGEAAGVPTAPAIANAIYHATGIRMKELPITPEKLLKALKDSS